MYVVFVWIGRKPMGMCQIKIKEILRIFSHRAYEFLYRILRSATLFDLVCRPSSGMTAYKHGRNMQHFLMNYKVIFILDDRKYGTFIEMQQHNRMLYTNSDPMLQRMCKGYSWHTVRSAN
jgi:hypothetical protein